MNTIVAFVMPGGAEWMIIFVVLLLLFGAKKLPELARGIGRSLGEFRKAKDEFEHEISFSEQQLQRENDLRNDEERRRKFAESKKVAEEAEANPEPEAEAGEDAGVKTASAESGEA